MEVYLNSIEMGEGIYGVEAVAKEHFNSTALKLNPRRVSSKHPSAYMLKRQARIEREMRHVPLFPKKGEDVKKDNKK